MINNHHRANEELSDRCLVFAACCSVGCRFDIRGYPATYRFQLAKEYLYPLKRHGMRFRLYASSDCADITPRKSELIVKPLWF